MRNDLCLVGISLKGAGERLPLEITSRGGGRVLRLMQDAGIPLPQALERGHLGPLSVTWLPPLPQ